MAATIYLYLRDYDKYYYLLLIDLLLSYYEFLDVYYQYYDNMESRAFPKNLAVALNSLCKVSPIYSMSFVFGSIPIFLTFISSLDFLVAVYYVLSH